jgi:predicted NAD/FAD-dependent oxidoreductase
MKQRIAIIGAGISGLTLAQNLREHCDVVVFEKARGVGGRMSTRYADPFFFDHGTQFFTARTKQFQAFIAPLIEQEVIAPWQGKVITFQDDGNIKDRLWFEPHYVATPHMNSLCKYLANAIEIRLSTEVAPLLEKQHDGWHLSSKEGEALGAFDWVISTAPFEQTLKLFDVALPDSSPLQAAPMQGCYTLMIGFNAPWNKPWIAAKVHDRPIEWIAINSTKPARNKNVTAIIAHSSNDWADAHIDDDMQLAQNYLMAQFEEITGIDCQKADYLSTHRWKYALVKEGRESGFYLNDQSGVAATGDWLSHSRIEDVWLGALKLANEIKNKL